MKEAVAGVEIKGAVLYELIFKVKGGPANSSKKALAIPNEGRVRVEAVRLRYSVSYSVLFRTLFRDVIPTLFRSVIPYVITCYSVTIPSYSVPIP